MPTPPFPRPQTPTEWLAQNAPAPPLGPAPPLPLPLPPPAKNEAPRASPLAFEQLYGPGAEGLLADVVDDKEYSQEHRDLAWSVLSGEKPIKKLIHEDRTLFDEIAHQMAGTTPKGHKPHRPASLPPVKRTLNPFDEDTSFTMDKDQDRDPDMAFSPSDSDKRG